VRIRPFRRGDAKTVVSLVRALARYEKLMPPSPAAGRRLVRDVGKRVEVLLAEEGGVPVGYAIYLFTYSSFLARPTLFLEDLFVLPEHRGKGVGRAFFDALIRKARRAGCGRMEWFVLDWNKPAIRFYKKLGAKPLSDWITYRIGLS